MHTYMHKCIHTCIHAYIHAYMHTHTCIHTVQCTPHVMAFLRYPSTSHSKSRALSQLLDWSEKKPTRTLRTKAL